VVTHLDAHTYDVYRNPLRVTSKDELRDGNDVIYALKQNHVLSWGYTLEDGSSHQDLWTARSGIGVWTKFTNQQTQEEVELSRHYLHLAYTFDFSYNGEEYLWQQELPTLKYKMHLFRTTGGRKVKLATLHRTFFQVHKRAEITVLPTLVSAIQDDPTFEGLFVAMAMRLNEEIKSSQKVTAAAVVGTGVVISRARSS